MFEVSHAIQGTSQHQLTVLNLFSKREFLWKLKWGTSEGSLKWGFLYTLMNKELPVLSIGSFELLALSIGSVGSSAWRCSGGDTFVHYSNLVPTLDGRKKNRIEPEFTALQANTGLSQWENSQNSKVFSLVKANSALPPITSTHQGPIHCPPPSIIYKHQGTIYI